MPVTGLEVYLTERGLVQECKLLHLKDTRLGIDAQHWFRMLLEHPKYKEPFVSVTGGSPLNAYTPMEAELRELERNRIKPVFVFQGLSPNRKERPFGFGPGGDAAAGKLRLRHQGWERYTHKDMEGAIACFGQSSSVQPQDVLNQIHRLFRTRQVEYLVAPYLNWAQLVYLERHPKSYVHALCGGTELFMFDGVDRVILSVDFQRGVIRFASKSAILTDVALPHDQFLDACILAGFDLSPAFPLFTQTPDFHFKHAVDMVRRWGGGLQAVMAYADYPPAGKSNYLDAFCRARCMVKYSLVTVAEEGRVLPLPLAAPNLTATGSSPSASIATSATPSGSGISTAADVPSDLHEIFSHKFPDEVYFQLCRAMISPTLLNVLAGGMWVEQAPLCGGETEDYWSFVRETLTEGPTSPRCVALGLVAVNLHQFWQKKPISVVYYFDPMNSHSIPTASPQTLALVQSSWDWNVHAPVIEEELKRQNSSTIDISLCLGATATPALAARTRTPRKGDVKVHHPLEKKDEVVANTLFRFLCLRGYLAASDHSLTAWGSALHRALASAKVNDKLQEPLVLALELIKADRLHSGRYGGRSWVGTAHLGGEEDQRCMLLVMRVLSILPLHFKPMSWQGPLSRDLLVFNSFVKATGRSLRLLVEATVLSLVLRNDAKRSREDGMEVGLSLPFQQDPNTGMGILFKGYADMLLQEREERWEEPSRRNKAGMVFGMTEQEMKEIKADILEGAGEGFPMVRDVKTELNRGFRFWDATVKAVRALDEGKVVNKGLVEQFEAANAWLEPFRLS